MQKKKKKIRFKALLAILLICYLLIAGTYYFLNKPLKKIIFTGNTYLKDNYLINYLDISKESIFKVKSKSVKEKLLALNLISDVKIHKNYLGTLKIEIEENQVLFYDLGSKRLVLSSGEEVEATDFADAYLGIPVLTNEVPSNIYQELIKKMPRIHKDILTNISEIAYNPSMVQEKIVDDKRFSLLMNDGNVVYINTVNIEKINDYFEIYEGIVKKNGNKKGCLYLDSSSENNHFNNCEAQEKDDGEN